MEVHTCGPRDCARGAQEANVGASANPDVLTRERRRRRETRAASRASCHSCFMQAALRILWLIAVAVGCGGSIHPSPPKDALDIYAQSISAIVGIRAGQSKDGLGFVLDANGLIATSFHVIQGESELRVTL